MTQITKATEVALSVENQRKDTSDLINTQANNENSLQLYGTLRMKTLQLLKSGEYTSFQIDTILGTTDARKRISELRRLGYNISDRWILHPTRRKLYSYSGMNTEATPSTNDNLKGIIKDFTECLKTAVSLGCNHLIFDIPLLDRYDDNYYVGTNEQWRYRSNGDQVIIQQEPAVWNCEMKVEDVTININD